MPFSPKTLDFLFENRLHDSREWFEEHKEAYREHVLRPLCELSAALGPQMLRLDSCLVTEPRVDRTISRIRRDTRFSHDKSLYRDHMWIAFQRQRIPGAEWPGLYFQISEEGFEYGCGYYQASPRYMEVLRQQVLEGGETFWEAQEALKALPHYRLEGERYKRPRYPDQPVELRQWLELRGVCVLAESKDFPLLFSERLGEMLARELTALGPVYRFLLQAAQIALSGQEESL